MTIVSFICSCALLCKKSAILKMVLFTLDAWDRIPPSKRLRLSWGDFSCSGQLPHRLG